MGGNYSILPEAPSNYFFLTFRKPDKISLVFADDSMIEIIRQSILKCWSKGLEKEKTEKDGSYRFHLKESPFDCNKRESSFQSKRMCCKILADLYNAGWRLMLSSVLARQHDYSTLFFQRFPTTYDNGPPALITCLSLSQTNSLQLINVAKDEELKTMLKDTVRRNYAPGLAGEFRYESEYELKLKGCPWDTLEDLSGQTLLLDIFRAFDAKRYRFYGTVNMKGGTDCIFFVHNEKYQPDASCSFMMVSLNRLDRLRLIDCPENLLDTTRRVIKSAWPRGLQSESVTPDYGAFEFKLKGDPWWTENSADAVYCRRIITTLIKEVLPLGWIAVTSLRVSRRVNEKSVFLFKTCRQRASLLQSQFCISMNSTNILRLIDVPPDVREVVGSLIAKTWVQGLKRQRSFHESVEFEFNGTPWESNEGNDNLLSRCLMCYVLKELTDRGYRVLCSANVSTRYCNVQGRDDHPLDIHSWFVTGNNAVRSV